MTDPLRVHLVWSHPRTDSLTTEIVSRVTTWLDAHGASVDELDLYRSGFDPVLPVADEPDWDDEDKTYSPETEVLIERVQEADVIVVVFPLWWYGLPAILKGYFDRVWNNGRLYGDGRRANARSIVWIALAGLSEASLAKRGHDVALRAMLDDGIAGYCGIESSRVVLLDDTLEDIDLDRFDIAIDAALTSALGDARS